MITIGPRHPDGMDSRFFELAGAHSSKSIDRLDTGRGQQRNTQGSEWEQRDGEATRHFNNWI